MAAVSDLGDMSVKTPMDTRLSCLRLAISCFDQDKAIPINELISMAATLERYIHDNVVPQSQVRSIK